MLETFVTKGPLLAFTPISKNMQIKIIKIGVKYLPSISITEVDLKENKNTKIKYIIEKIIKLLKLNISKLTAQVLGIAIKGPKHANINILNIFEGISPILLNTLSSLLSFFINAYNPSPTKKTSPIKKKISDKGHLVPL